MSFKIFNMLINQFKCTIFGKVQSKNQRIDEIVDFNNQIKVSFIQFQCKNWN